MIGTKIRMNSMIWNFGIACCFLKHCKTVVYGLGL